MKLSTIAQAAKPKLNLQRQKLQPKLTLMPELIHFSLKKLAIWPLSSHQLSSKS